MSRAPVVEAYRDGTSLIRALRVWREADQADVLALTRHEVIELLKEIEEEYHAGVARD